MSEARERAIQMYTDLVAGASAGIDEFRQMYAEFGRNFALPEGTTVEPVDAGGVPAEWLTAPGATDERTIVFFHGGGYVIGDLDSHRSLSARISAASGARVLAVDYRRGPEDPYPAANDDALAAIRWVWETGGTPAQTVLCGDSAGGGLALLSLIALRDAGGPQAAGAAVISPWTDLACSGPSVDTNPGDAVVSRAMLEELGGAYVQGAVELDDPRVSPLYAELAGLPDILILASSDEALQDDGIRFGDRARATGTTVTVELTEGMQHVWPVFDFLPEATDAVARIGRFARERTGSATAAAG